MADCFKMFDINLVEQSVVTPSSVNALFPAKNVKDVRRSKVFRSLSNSDNLILDFQESSEVDVIFIVADKRSGYGVSTVTVEFNATSDFTSPAYSVSVPLSQRFGVSYVELPATIEYRFARIVMTSTLGYCELSNVFMGKKISTKRSISFGWTYKNDELSIKTANRYGQQFTDVILRQATIAMSFKLVEKDDLNKFQTVFDRVGETKPVYIIIGTEEMCVDPRRYAGPFILNDIPTETNTKFNKYSFPLTLKEVT